MATKKKNNNAMSLGKGRPKHARLSTESIVEKIEFEILKANRNAANNLEKYFETLNRYALGETGSDTNIISSAKYMISVAEKYLEENTNQAKGSVDDKQDDEEQLANGTTGQVYSLIQTSFDED